MEGKDLDKVKLYVLIETIQSCNVCQTIGKLASISAGNKEEVALLVFKLSSSRFQSHLFTEHFFNSSSLAV